MIRLCFNVSDVDFNALIDRFVPVLLENAAKSDDAKLRALAALPQGLAVGMLKSLSCDKKEELAVSLLSGYKDKIAAMLAEEALRQGISVTIDNISADRI